jgi:hypothetical protein
MGQSFNWKDKGGKGCLCHVGEPKGIGAKRQTQSLDGGELVGRRVTKKGSRQVRHQKPP